VKMLRVGLPRGSTCIGCMFCAYDRVGGSHDPEAQRSPVGCNHTHRQMYTCYASCGTFYMDFFKVCKFRMYKEMELKFRG
jgi:hypothetical protein